MQEKRLLETLDTCRNLYNHFLFESRLSYKEGYKINHYEMSAIIPMLTKGKEEIYSKVTQPVLDQFYRNISVLNASKKKGIKIGSYGSSQKTDSSRLRIINQVFIYCMIQRVEVTKDRQDQNCIA